MVNLKTKPFNLANEDILWVEKTIKSLSLEEKLGQLFFPIGLSEDEAVLKGILDHFHVGGMLFRAMDGEKIQNIHRILQSGSKLPLILCANVETGGDGIAADGTRYGTQMQVAATGNPQSAHRLGAIAATEGAAVGLNLALGPICDIDQNYLNPITNVRTYGSGSEQVKQFALECARGLRENGLFACAKHFPGDGVDDRDQHLLTSVNRLGREDWGASFGAVYQQLIDDGVEVVMAGHIALPCYQSEPQRYLPATLSSDLLQGLLREQMGFNGLIMTDATPMTGFCAAMERRKAIPHAIESGCDVILFNKDLAEDFGYLLEGYQNGLLSEERLNDALMRILGTKAAMKLHTKSTLVPDTAALSSLACDEHVSAAVKCADEAVTLVKNACDILPVKPEKYKRILLQVLGSAPSNERVEKVMTELLASEGFDVTNYRPESFATLQPKVEDFKAKYDLVLYIANIETLSNQTTARINWHTMFGQGNNIPWFACEVPVVMVSVGNPYHLLDAPMVPCYINAYFNSDIVLNAVVDKLLGRSEFKGVSPVDPFCGREELKLGPADGRPRNG